MDKDIILGILMIIGIIAVVCFIIYGTIVYHGLVGLLKLVFCFMCGVIGGRIAYNHIHADDEKK